jgi:hypothetical protein
MSVNTFEESECKNTTCITYYEQIDNLISDTLKNSDNNAAIESKDDISVVKEKSNAILGEANQLLASGQFFQAGEKFIEIYKYHKNSGVSVLNNARDAFEKVVDPKQKAL